MTDFVEQAHGSVLISFGKTRVLCTAMVEERVPRWLQRSGRGWMTAEYSLLPGSTGERVDRYPAMPGRLSAERLLRSVVATPREGESVVFTGSGSRAARAEALAAMQVSAAVGAFMLGIAISGATAQVIRWEIVSSRG